MLWGRCGTWGKPTLWSRQVRALRLGLPRRPITEELVEQIVLDELRPDGLADLRFASRLTQAELEVKQSEIKVRLECRLKAELLLVQNPRVTFKADPDFVIIETFDPRFGMDLSLLRIP